MIYVYGISTALFMEEGVISVSSTHHCHNITFVDDDVVEESEHLQISLVHVFNVATVLLRPNMTTIIIQDDDSKGV